MSTLDAVCLFLSLYFELAVDTVCYAFLFISDFDWSRILLIYSPEAFYCLSFTLCFIILNPHPHSFRNLTWIHGSTCSMVHVIPFSGYLILLWTVLGYFCSFWVFLIEMTNIFWIGLFISLIPYYSLIFYFIILNFLVMNSLLLATFDSKIHSPIFSMIDWVQ